MATLKWTDGKFYDVPDDKVQQALRDGFVSADPAQVAASEQTLQAGVEAAVRTAIPLGIGEALVTGFEMGGGKSEEQVLAEQSARQKENPVASAIGTGVGFLAPAKALSPFTGAMRARGLVGMAQAGALEGTALGINEAINESIIENKPLTAEKLAANVLEAGATGAAFDFGMGAVGKGASAILKKVGGTSLSNTLSEAGTKTSLGMIETKRWAKKYGAFEDDIAKVAREEGVLSRATSLDDASVAAADAARERIGQQMGDELLKAQKYNAPAHQKIVDDVLGKLKKYDKLGPMAQGALDEVQAQLEYSVGAKSPWSDLWDMQRRWRVKAEDATSLRGEIISDARMALRDAILDNAPKQVGSMGQSLKELNKRYAAISAFADGLEDATLSFKSRGMGFKELVAGAYVGGVPGMGVAAATHSVRKRGGFLLGETLNSLGQSDIVNSVAKSLHKNLSQRMSVAPELFGAFRNTIEAALVQGPEATMDTHSSLAMSRVGPEYLSALGMEAETPEQMSGIGQKLSTFEALSRLASDRDEATASAIDGIFGSAPGRKGSVGSTLSVKDYEKFMALNKQMLSDPEAAWARIPPEISGVASETAGLTAMTVLNAARYLQLKAPRDPYEGMPESVRPQWQPSPADLDRFNRVKEAVERPAQVLKNMANGYIAPEQVEALKSVYPALYSDLQQKIGERLATWQKPLSYQQKLAFSAILGSKALGMSPQQVQILQQSMASAQGAQQQGAGGKPSKPDGRQDVNEAQIQTEAQKLEART